jgi:hypothetical protein
MNLAASFSSQARHIVVVAEDGSLKTFLAKEDYNPDQSKRSLSLPLY